MQPDGSPPYTVVRLSKSRIATFEHCSRRLWLSVHRRDLAVIDPGTEYIFALGHRFGELARDQVPNGILLDTDPGRIEEAIEETKAILAGPWTRPIFEAALRYDGVVVRPDILQPDGWGGWKLIEVKSGTSIREHYLRDAATQAWVARGSGLCISSVIIRHAQRRLRSPFARALPAPPIDIDVTGSIQNLILGRPSVAAAARVVISGPEPRRSVGPHCVYPFRCEFRQHCQQLQSSPEGAEKERK